MPTYTDYLKLSKPDGTDIVSHDRYNVNMDILDRKNNAQDDRLNNAESDIDSLENRMDNAEDEINKLKKRVTQCESDITNITGDINNIKTDITNIKNDITNIDADTNSLKKRITNLENRVTVNENKISAMGTMLKTIVENMYYNATIEISNTAPYYTIKEIELNKVKVAEGQTTSGYLSSNCWEIGNTVITNKKLYYSGDYTYSLDELYALGRMQGGYFPLDWNKHGRFHEETSTSGTTFSGPMNTELVQFNGNLFNLYITLHESFINTHLRALGSSKNAYGDPYFCLANENSSVVSPTNNNPAMLTVTSMVISSTKTANANIMTASLDEEIVKSAPAFWYNSPEGKELEKYE